MLSALSTTLLFTAATASQWIIFSPTRAFLTSHLCRATVANYREEKNIFAISLDRLAGC